MKEVVLFQHQQPKYNALTFLTGQIDGAAQQKSAEFPSDKGK